MEKGVVQPFFIDEAHAHQHHHHRHPSKSIPCLSGLLTSFFFIFKQSQLDVSI